MKIKKLFLALCLMALIIIPTTGCGESGTNDSAEAVSEEKSEQEMPTDNSVYDNIISEYQRILNGEKLNTQIMTKEESGFTSRNPGFFDGNYLEGGYDSYEVSDLVKLNYAYYDINGDNIDELLVASFWDRESTDEYDEYVGTFEQFFYPDYYSIWTVKNNKPHNLFWGAERFNKYSVLENGIIACESSGSAYNVEYRFYRINESLSPEKIAAACCDIDYDLVPEEAYDEGDLDDYICYYPNDTYEGESSKAKYNEIVNNYLRDPVLELQEKENWESINE